MKEVIIQTPEGVIDQAKKIAKKKLFVLLDMEDIILLRKKKTINQSKDDRH